MANEIVLAITCDLDRKRLWNAWSDPKARARWWAPDVLLEMEVGGRFSDSYPDDSGGRLETHGKVTECEIGKRLSFTWQESLWPKGFDSLVTFELSGDEGATRVQVTHAPLPGFDETLWARVRVDFIGGWMSLLQSLRQYVHRCESPSRHDIVIEKKLETPRSEAFRSWTSESLLCEWLCAKACVELCHGGAFELFWNADGSKENSTSGCSLVSVDAPDRFQAQWRGPSHIALMDTPGSTVIQVSFVEKGGQTTVRLEHVGFGPGSEWDAARGWQKMAWETAFSRLE